jgi:hypothetical protein
MQLLLLLRHTRRVGLSAGNMDAILASDFNTIHRTVGGLEKAFGRVGDIGECRQTDRGSDPVAGAAVGKEHITLNPVAEAPGDRLGPLDSGFRQEDGKLVAAEAGDDVGLAGAAANDSRCPWASLMRLNPSRSMKRSDSGQPLRMARLVSFRSASFRYREL